jgi:F420 biosynthesis protein FbiB-like protein
MSEPGVFETIYQCRAIRYLKPDPVPDDLVRKILDAAIRAPSGSHRQCWHFVVVRDPAIRKRIQELYRQAFDMYAKIVADVPPREGVSAESVARVYRSAEHLADHMHEAPLYVIPCLVNERGRIEGDGTFQTVGRKSLYASIYPAVQNLLLACRAYGLGACLTTLHLMHEEEIAKLLGLPDNVETMCLIPVGWPAAKFGPVTRVPVEQVSSLDRWGTPLPR